MELKHSFSVPVPADRAWDVLLDVEQVAPCMPGATLDSVDGDDITGKIKVKVGPISMTYTGKASFTERNREAGVVTLEASGKDTRGAGTASATVRSELTGAGSETQVTVTTNLSVTGKSAEFDQDVLNEVSGKLIGIFADNLAKMLGADESGATESGATESGATESGTADDLSTPIEDLSLPVRAYNGLRREGVHTVGDLVARTPQDLLAIDNIGPASVEEIKQRLAARGLSLSESGHSANGSSGHAAAFPATPAPAASPEPAGTTPESSASTPEPATATPEPATATPEPATAPAETAGQSAPALRTVPAPAASADVEADDAIDLLSVVGVPMLKRLLPVAAGVAGVAVVVLGLRRRIRSRR